MLKPVRGSTVLLATVALACSSGDGPPSPQALQRFTRHVGQVTSVTERPDARGTLLTIRTSAGIQFDALVHVPPGPGPFPGAVLADGRELGRHALVYLPE